MADELSTLQARFVPQPGVSPSPHKGLLYFTEDDADNFFGRETWTARIVSGNDDQTLGLVQK